MRMMELASAAPWKAGLETLVMLSVAEAPLSLEASKSGAAVAVGAVRSTVTRSCSD